jgi:S1-C subfamily serine protease
MRRLAPALAALAVGAAGCGGATSAKDSDQSATAAGSASGASAETSSGRFDPAGIYRRQAPGVVTVISEFGDGRGPLGPGGEQGGQGTGFVVSRSGEVATNAHVVTTGEGSSIRRARAVFVQFRDGNEVAAKIVGQDPNADVALLRIDPDGLNLHSLPLGSSAKLTVGIPVALIGSPFGQTESLSVGVISGLDRTIESLTNFQITGAIQTDAAINRGNSGGPLLDGRGDVVGIASQISSTSGASQGVGFAVPVDTVKRSLAALRRDGKVRYAYLGVATVAVYPQLARRLKLGSDHGVSVQQVTPGSPAAKAGVRGGRGSVHFQGRDYRVGGDVIVKADGITLREDTDLSKAVADNRPGQTVELEIVRGGRRQTLRVKLGERPLERPRRLLP